MSRSRECSQAREAMFNRATARYAARVNTYVPLEKPNHTLSRLLLAGSAVGLAITLNFGSGLVEAGSPTPTPTSTAPATPDAFAPLRSVIKSVKDLKEINNELNDVFSGSPKDSRPQPQPVPAPVPDSKVVVVYPPQPSQDSTDAGIKAAMAIETIVKGRLNEKDAATARAAYPTPYSTPRPVQVEILSPATPINIRITEDRGLPWWQTVLLTLGGVGIGAGIFARRRRIIAFIHNHTAPAAGPAVPAASPAPPAPPAGP